MGSGARLVALAVALGCGEAPAAGWGDMLVPEGSRPARPKPVEPDAPNSGPFKAPAVAYRPLTVIPGGFALMDSAGVTWTNADGAYLRKYVDWVDAGRPAAPAGR